MTAMIRDIVRLFVLVGFILGGSSFGLAEVAPGPESLTKLIEGAKKEGGFTLYHSTSIDDTKLFLERFTRKYPFIKVTTYRALQEALISRVEMERRAKTNKWDVMFLNCLFLNDLKNKGVLQKYEASGSKAYTKGFRDNDGFWNGLLINAFVIGYNTKLVKPADVPKSLMDLLEPKFKGKIAIDAAPYEWLLALEREWGKEKAWDYIKRLGRQEIYVRRGSSLLAQLLAAGEYPLALPLHSWRLEQMKRAGASVDWQSVDPAAANMVGTAISVTANNPNTARLFTEFTLSEEGQQAVRDLGRIPARFDIKPNPARLTEGIRIVPSAPLQPGDIPRVLNEFKALL